MRGLDPYEPCPCGSGKKYKFCCRAKERKIHFDPVAIDSARGRLSDPACERTELAGPAWYEGAYHGSFLNHNWRVGGLAILLNFRRVGDLLYGHSYLIDVWGLGLKDCYPLRPTSEADLHVVILPKYAKESKPEACPEEIARMLAWGGLHWGRQNGFRPPRCWDRCLPAVGEEPDGPRVDPRLFGVGHEVHIVGEWEDVQTRMEEPMEPQEAMEVWLRRGFQFTIGTPKRT